MFIRFTPLLIILMGLTASLAAVEGPWLTARAQGVDQVVLNWSDTITGSLELQRTQNLRDWTSVVAITSGRNYTDRGLASGTLYHYRLVNGNGQVQGNWIPILTQIPVSGQSQVERPLGQWQGDEVLVSWRENFGDETGFRITRSDGMVVNLPANTQNWRDSSPPSGQVNKYAIIAIGPAGESASVEAVAATSVYHLNDYNQYFPLPVSLNAAIAAPTGLSASWSDHNTLVFSWSDQSTNETGFRISRSWSSDGAPEYISPALSAGTTSWAMNGALSTAPLYLRVFALGAGSTISASSNTIIVQPPSFDFTLPAPQNFQVTEGGSGIELSWSPVAGASGYLIETPTASNNRLRFTTLATGASTSYTDSSGNAFKDYRVRALSEQGAGPPTEIKDAFVSTSVINPPAPTGLLASAAGDGQIDLTWNVITNYSGTYLIQRSMDGGPYEIIASASKATDDASTVSYSDQVVRPGRSYLYRVAAEHQDRHSSAYTAAILVRPTAYVIAPAAPTGFSATGTSSNCIELSWNSTVRSHTIEIERSRDGGSWQRIATLDAQLRGYSDTAVAGASSLSYRLRSLSPLGSSAWTAVVNTVPYASDPTISIGTRSQAGFTILDVSGTAAADNIEIQQSGQNIVIVVAGSTYQSLDDIDEVQVRGLGGDDRLRVAPSVSKPVLLYGGDGNDQLIADGSGYQAVVAVGHGADHCSGTGGRAYFWLDQAELDQAAMGLTVHNQERVMRVHNFIDGSNKILDGQDIPEPAGYPGKSTLTSYQNSSLFGRGPGVYDVDQGAYQDCPFTSVYAGLALQRPELLYRLAVDLGDGSYAVAHTGGFRRVDGEFYESYLSMPGPEGTIWWMVLEKAYVSFGSKSPSRGTTLTLATATDPDALFQGIQSSLNNGALLTAFTPTGQLNAGLITSAQHAHTILQAWRDDTGEAHILIRNPYGQQTEHNNANQPDPELGLLDLTMSQFQSNFAWYNSLDLYPSLIDPQAASNNLNPIDLDGDGRHEISLDGNASSDSDGNITSAVWSVTIDNEVLVTEGLNSTLELPVGQHELRLLVTDNDSLAHEVMISVHLAQRRQISVQVSGHGAPMSVLVEHASGDQVSDSSGPAIFDPLHSGTDQEFGFVDVSGNG